LRVARFSPFLPLYEGKDESLTIEAQVAPKRERPALHDLLAAHFAPAPLDELVVARRDFPHWLRPDLQRAIERLVADLPGTRFFGARLRDHDLEFRFADLAEGGRKAIAAGPAEFQDVDIGEPAAVRCLVRGLWLGAAEGAPFALLLDVAEGYRGVRARIEIAAPPGEAGSRTGARLAERLRVETERGDAWRGKALVLDRAHADFEISAAGVRVAPLAPVPREDIVLPEQTLALVERNTLGFARDAERLARLGLSARKGVLLYGPPGTGKTMVVRWLVGALPGYTKLLVAAGEYVLLGDYLAIARTLQPALVVLEDVDLVAGHRDGPWAGPGAVLNRLLNEMDGLALEARVLFVLTTNRPKVLEPALAARPGRIDQAIEIGLPGEAERLRLVRRYAGALEVGEALAAAHEYVDGVIYAMAGAGERHNRIAPNIGFQLRAAARGTPCGVYVSDMKLRAAHASAYYYPDVILSCEPASPETVFKEAPCFIAEVLSPSTAAIDTREKLRAYRGIESLRYYVLVDSDRVSVAYHLRGDDGGWLAANLDPGEHLEIVCGPVRTELTLASIYEDTGLAVS
jgi:Uma2 family endonuclease